MSTAPKEAANASHAAWASASYAAADETGSPSSEAMR